MSRLRRWGLIWGSAFYNDAAPTALWVDSGLVFYNDAVPRALGGHVGGAQ